MFTGFVAIFIFPTVKDGILTSKIIQGQKIYTFFCPLFFLV